MQKKLLITVSDDKSYLHGVRFVGSFFRNKSAVSATLFYVAPLADFPGRDSGFGYPELERKATEAGRKKGQEALDTARQMLIQRGFPPENITTRLIFRQFGTVKDIVREARAGEYDAVVLGRRGYTLFESILSTSVTKEILDYEKIDFPIWICKLPDENRRNVLVCVDGSEASMRTVDHVGFMLRGEDEHSVTLLHVDTGEAEDKDAILSEARRHFQEHWISNGRLKAVVVGATVTGVGKAILDEAELGGYAVVGVGRVGTRKGRLKEWLVGSRTMKLLESIEKATLWVSS